MERYDTMCDGDVNPAAVPTAVNDVQGDGRWMSLHNHFVASSKDKEPEVVFIGDSNVQLLHQLEIWRELFSPLHALNFGGLGDGTQHVLWRLKNGELDHIKPKIIVLWVGTYNCGHTAEQIAGGIQAIVQCMQRRQPQAKVIVLGLLPRGQHPNPLRERNRRVNELLAVGLQSMPNATFLDVDPGFVHSDGTISHHDMIDYLHLSRLGYSRVCQTIHKTLLRLLEGRGTATQQ
ncbi:platelet-activating factor acetylhydrolase IB subunit alpha1 isoform X2 [Dendropsophus ebraccatus]|uniref:platelet-activating factor acetylhydrolase IB subunit alpha1 isoform X2 n=1 Tax=Dendropsophus ebraccatus TaxID=150705 RepID=UPI0038320D5D